MLDCFDISSFAIHYLRLDTDSQLALVVARITVRLHLYGSPTKLPLHEPNEMMAPVSETAKDCRRKTPLSEAHDIRLSLQNYGEE